MVAVAVLGVFAVLGVVMVLTTILRGWVLTYLWQWFMVPVFGLPPLTIAPAIGIALVIGYLTKQVDPDVEEKRRTTSEKAVRALLIGFLGPLLALFMGWIVHSFM